MSGSNVAGLIPDRDSDSSDDEFLDALDKIENEPEPECVDNTGSLAWRWAFRGCLSVLYNIDLICDPNLMYYLPLSISFPLIVCI